MGDSLYMDFWPHWLSDLALQKGAVVISPNYRLMPEATSAEIYNDVDDFWTWLHSSALASLLARHSTPTELDLNRVLAAGDSAGGLLGIYLALAYPAELRAALVAYPWVNPASEYFNAPRTSPPFGQHTLKAVIDRTMSSVAAGTPASSVTSPDRFVYMLAACEHGAWRSRGLQDLSKQTWINSNARLNNPGIETRSIEDAIGTKSKRARNVHKTRTAHNQCRSPKATYIYIWVSRGGKKSPSERVAASAPSSWS